MSEKKRFLLESMSGGAYGTVVTWGTSSPKRVFKVI